VRTIFAAAVVVTALFAGLNSRVAFGDGEQLAASGDNGQADEEVIVRGQARGRIRLEIQRAEDAVYDRFNEINSNDLYDIHCYERTVIDTHIKRRICQSNAWRRYDAAMGEATVRGLQSGVAGGNGEFAQAQGLVASQLATERLIRKEMASLARSDPKLAAAMVRLGQAYRADELVRGSPPDSTLYREIDAGEEDLPGGAARRFEVRIGEVAWSHPLTSRTFTIQGVEGRIRSMRLDCDKGEQKLEYMDEVDWNVPDAWGACTLDVGAKRGTTFALYEYD
jgi:hypothetical protein